MDAPWNPLFVAYARVHGREPQQQLDHDDKAWPGGCMCGFILWMEKLREQFWKLHPECFLDHFTIYDHKAWYAYVTSQT